MVHQTRQSTTTELPFTQLLKRNDLAIIENPLRRIPEDRLEAYIESFYEESDLINVIDIDTLIRGARLARDEEAFIAEEKAEENLTQVESLALKKEKSTTIWTESREIKIILLTCCVGSIVQGWVSTLHHVPTLASNTQGLSSQFQTSKTLTRSSHRLKALSWVQIKHGHVISA